MVETSSKNETKRSLSTRTQPINCSFITSYEQKTFIFHQLGSENFGRCVIWKLCKIQLLAWTVFNCIQQREWQTYMHLQFVDLLCYTQYIMSRLALNYTVRKVQCDKEISQFKPFIFRLARYEVYRKSLLGQMCNIEKLCWGSV